MKFILLFLTFCSSLTFARPLPQGNLKVIITRSEWIKNADVYEYKRSPVCILVTTFKTLIPNGIYQPVVAGTCDFIYKGNTYTAKALYNVLYNPKDPELGPHFDFNSSVVVTPKEDNEMSPFANIRFGSASTRDLNVKNMIVKSEAMTECPSNETYCVPDASIDGSFDFEVR